MTRAVLGVAARHGVVELRGSSGEQDVKDEEVVGLEACCDNGSFSVLASASLGLCTYTPMFGPIKSRRVQPAISKWGRVANMPLHGYGRSSRVFAAIKYKVGT